MRGEGVAQKVAVPAGGDAKIAYPPGILNVTSASACQIIADAFSAVATGYTTTFVPTGSERASWVNHAGTSAWADEYGHAGTSGSRTTTTSAPLAPHATQWCRSSSRAARAE